MYTCELLNEKISFPFEADSLKEDIESLIMMGSLMSYEVMNFYSEFEKIEIHGQDGAVMNLVAYPFLRYFFKKDDKEINLVIFLDEKNSFKEMTISFRGQKTKTGKRKKDNIFSFTEKEEMQEIIKKAIKSL